MKPVAPRDARKDYLESAASSLLVSSPAVSAHLRLASRSSPSDGVLSEQRQVSSCSACGNVLIPGWSCKTLAESPSKRTRKDRIEKRRGNIKTIRLQCQSCDAVTSIESTKPTRTTNRPNAFSEPDIAPKDRPSEHDTAKPAEPKGGHPVEQSSRKRGRGKKPTLQSMLSEQQASANPAQKGFGLGLMDFMKT